jgi:toxin HigB-1
VIKSFTHKGLKKFFETGNTSGIKAQHANRIRRQLDQLNASVVVQDMNIPGWNLHELKGDRKGIWSITVSGNWRITFEFRDGNAYVVNYEDYH